MHPHTWTVLSGTIPNFPPHNPFSTCTAVSSTLPDLPISLTHPQVPPPPPTHTAPALTCSSFLIHSCVPCSTHIIPFIHPYALVSILTTPRTISRTLAHPPWPTYAFHVPLAPFLTCYSLPTYWSGACKFLLASTLTLVGRPHKKLPHLKKGTLLTMATGIAGFAVANKVCIVS